MIDHVRQEDIQTVELPANLFHPLGETFFDGINRGNSLIQGFLGQLHRFHFVQVQDGHSHFVKQV